MDDVDFGNVAFTASRCLSALRQFKCLTEYGVYENVSQVSSSPAYFYDVCQWTLDACESYIYNLVLSTGISSIQLFLGLPLTCDAISQTNCIPSRHYSLLNSTYEAASEWDSGDYSNPSLYIYPKLFNSTDVGLCPNPMLYAGESNRMFVAN